MKILIADDDLLMRTILHRHLTAWGHEPVEAINGSDAWEKLTCPDAPRLAILDWFMPGMDGLDICRKLLERKGKLLYTILLTSHSEKNHVAEALSLGAYDFHAKPIDPEELLSRVNVGIRLLEAEDARDKLSRELDQHRLHLEELVELRTSQLADAIARLAILDKAKSDFLRIISHELHTPLNGLFGFTELLFNEFESLHPKLAAYRDCFERSRQRITSLIDDALLLTYIEVRVEQSARGTCSLDLVLENIRGKTEGMAALRDIHIDHAAKELGGVFGEEQLLTKALQYLVKTAVKFSTKSNSVRMNGSTSDGVTNLVIEADGQTIPPHVLSRFFDALAIGDAITQEGDFGLSTAVAERIITLFGGEVSVENTTSPGIRMTVKLKAAPPEL